MDFKMSRDDLITALEICECEGNLECKGCYYQDFDDCRRRIASDALLVIKHGWEEFDRVIEEEWRESNADD